MKRYRTRWWKNIVEKQHDVCVIMTSDRVKIIRLLHPKENKRWKLQPNCSWTYDKYSISTAPAMIDLQTGEIFLSYYHNASLKFRQECFKMAKEYNKSYFDEFKEKVILRKKYNEAVHLYNWYDRKYDGKYNYMNILYKEQIADNH